MVGQTRYSAQLQCNRCSCHGLLLSKGPNLVLNTQPQFVPTPTTPHRALYFKLHVQVTNPPFGGHMACVDNKLCKYDLLLAHSKALSQACGPACKLDSSWPFQTAACQAVSCTITHFVNPLPAAHRSCLLLPANDRRPCYQGALAVALLACKQLRPSATN